MKTPQTKDVLVVAQPEEATEATPLAGPEPEKLTKDVLVVQAPPEGVPIVHQTRKDEANAQEDLNIMIPHQAMSSAQNLPPTIQNWRNRTSSNPPADLAQYQQSLTQAMCLKRQRRKY